jgi:Replication-relaxation
MRSPAPQRPSFVLSPTHAPILLALGRYRYLTQRQLKRRLFGRGSRSYPSERLRPLVAAGYVAEKRPPRPTRAGSTETVYYLDGKGRSHVEKLGIEIPERFRRSEEDERTYEHYAHALAIVDVFIATDLLAQGDPCLVVEAMLPDRVLRHRPMVVTLSTTNILTGEIQSKATKLIPDAFLLLRFDAGATPRTFPILLELDRGTEGSRTWREKIRAYLVAIAGPYQDAFGQESLTVAIVTPAGDNRVAQLLGWLEAELVGQGHQDAADIFLVTGADPAEADPWEFFLAPRWRSPLAREPLPLLEVPTTT